MDVHRTPPSGRPLAPFTAAHDVFGDGTVTLVHTPGHTPGSMGSSPGRQECRHSCPSAISPTTDTCWKPRSCQALLSTGHHGSERRSRKAAALSSAPTPPELCGTTGSLPRVPSTPGWHRFVPFRALTTDRTPPRDAEKSRREIASHRDFYSAVGLTGFEPATPWRIRPSRVLTGCLGNSQIPLS